MRSRHSPGGQARQRRVCAQRVDRYPTTPGAGCRIFIVSYIDKVLLCIQGEGVTELVGEAETPLVVEGSNENDRPFAQIGKGAGALAADDGFFPVSFKNSGDLGDRDRVCEGDTGSRCSVEGGEVSLFSAAPVGRGGPFAHRRPREGLNQGYRAEVARRGLDQISHGTD